MSRLRAGEEDAEAELLELLQDRIGRYARSLLRQSRLRDYESTEDLTSTVGRRFLVELRKSQHKDEFGPQVLSSLWNIARRAVIEKLRKHIGRKHKVRARVVPGGSADIEFALSTAASELTPEQLEMKFFISEAIEQLPEQQQEAVNLVYFEGETRVDVARSMQLSLKNLYTILAEAEAKLTQLLQDTTHTPQSTVEP